MATAFMTTVILKMNTTRRLYMCVFWLAAFVSLIMAAQPVLTSISVQGGPRGIALALGGDTPFEALFASGPGRAGKNSSDVRITVKNAVYGLASYSFSKTGSLSVDNIAVTEANGDIEIHIILKNVNISGIQSRKSGTKWLALLTKDPVPEFAWGTQQEQAPVKSAGARSIVPAKTASDYRIPPASVLPSAQIKPLKAPAAQTPAVHKPAPSKTANIEPSVQPAAVQVPAPQRTIVQEPAAAKPLTKETSGKSTAAVQSMPPPASLPAGSPSIADIRILQRGKTQELLITFNGIVAPQVFRSGDSIVVTCPVKNSKSQNVFTPAQGSVFSSIRIAPSTWSTTPATDIIVSINRKTGVIKGLPASVNSRQFAIFATAREARTVEWTWDKGSVWDNAIVAYQPDTALIKKRAVKDAESQVEADRIFAIHENPQTVQNRQAPAAKVPPAVPPQTVPLTASPAQQAAAAQTISAQQMLEMRKQASLPPAERQAAVAAAQQVKTVTAPAKMIPEPLFTIMNDVKLRSLPSTASSKITARLPIGQRCIILKTQYPWYYVKTGVMEGWVYSNLVKDSSKVTPEQWKEFRAARQSTGGEMENDADLEEILAKAGDNTINLTNQNKTEVRNADSILQEAAKKRMVRYHIYGRDPFIPLSKDSLWDSDLALVANCRIAGILYDPQDRIVLLEDMKNASRAYALREDDPVENGRVLKIYKEKAVFLINDFGISRSYTLHLKRDEEKKK